MVWPISSFSYKKVNNMEDGAILLSNYMTLCRPSAAYGQGGSAWVRSQQQAYSQQRSTSINACFETKSASKSRKAWASSKMSR